MQKSIAVVLLASALTPACGGYIPEPKAWTAPTTAETTPGTPEADSTLKAVRGKSDEENWRKARALAAGHCVETSRTATELSAWYFYGTIALGGLSTGVALGGAYAVGKEGSPSGETKAGALVAVGAGVFLGYLALSAWGRSKAASRLADITAKSVAEPDPQEQHNLCNIAIGDWNASRGEDAGATALMEAISRQRAVAERQKGDLAKAEVEKQALAAKNLAQKAQIDSAAQDVLRASYYAAVLKAFRAAPDPKKATLPPPPPGLPLEFVIQPLP